MIEMKLTGDVTTLTLNRPEKANALTEEMLAGLRDAVRAAETPVLVLTGAGKVFSAGADLEAAKAGLALSPLWERLSSAIARHPGLTIATLNGTVAGGAMGMVLACDLRIAAPGTKFFYPVMKLGYLPQPSDPVRMAALIGPARTKLIMLAGQKIDTDAALSFGLVDEIAADGDVLTRAAALCGDAIAAAPDTARAIKGLCPSGR